MQNQTPPRSPSSPMPTSAAIPLAKSWWRITLFVSVFLLLSGVPMLLAGMPGVLGRMIGSGIPLAFPILAMLVKPRTFRLTRFADFFPALLLTWFFIVSYISNSLVFGYGLNNWLFSMYLVMPILFYYLWWSIGLTVADIVVGLILIGTLCAVILLMDQLYQFPQLDGLKRLSAFTDRDEARRIVILRNENTLALLLMIVALLKLRGVASAGKGLVLAMLAGLCGLMIIRVFESRMPIFAVMSATLLYLVLSRISTKRRLTITVLLSIVAVPALVYVFSRYVTPIIELGLSGYADEFNVDVRFDSFAYWQEQFAKTYGLGIGVMSPNPETSNIQSDVIETKSFLLNDMGMAAALFQFGWVGLVAAIGATLYLIVGLFRLGRRSTHPYAPELLIMGCFGMAFELQPIPINFFTLVTAVPLGGTLWYALRRGRWEATQVQTAHSALAPPRQSSERTRRG